MRITSRLVATAALLLALVSASPAVFAQGQPQAPLFAPAPSVDVVGGRAAHLRQALATAQVLKAPSPGQGAPKPADLPAVICGLTLLPGDPAIDAKLQRPVQADGRQFTMRTVVPKICQP